MKKIFLAALTLIAIQLHAQNCTSYFFLQKGKTVEITIYDKKGNMGGKHVYYVAEVTSSGGITTALVNTEVFDKKGKSMAKSTNTIKCNGGVLLIDMKVAMPQQQQGQFNKAEGKADNFFMEYPNSVGVGDQLKDASLDMSFDNNGMQQSATMITRDRKVQDKEKITTPAGTWDCFKISQKTKLTIKTLGIGIPFNI